MQYKTHLAVTYAAVLPALVSTGNLTIGNTVALGVGALFPDIDHPKSFIGNRTGGISHSIGAVFGHRGLAHSILGIVFFQLISRWVLNYLQLPLEFADWFIVGYIAHLVEDSFSKTGVAWFQPLYSRRIQFGFKKLYYSTGKSSESLILGLALAALIYQVMQFVL
ncbi:metal-dependent hydrolase [Alkalibacterium sp. s-m-22]